MASDNPLSSLREKERADANAMDAAVPRSGQSHAGNESGGPARFEMPRPGSSKAQVEFGGFMAPGTKM